MLKQHRTDLLVYVCIGVYREMYCLEVMQYEVPDNQKRCSLGLFTQLVSYSGQLYLNCLQRTHKYPAVQWKDPLLMWLAFRLILKDTDPL